MLLDCRFGRSRVTFATQRGDFVGSGNAVRFRMSLGTAVLDTFTMTGIAIQSLLRMGMRQKVLHGFAVAHFAIVAAFLIAEDGQTEDKRQKAYDKHCATLMGGDSTAA